MHRHCLALVCWKPIPLTELLAKEDPEDLNDDGISGKAGSGRYGWKADVINLEEQTGQALSLDLGISSELFPQSIWRLHAAATLLPIPT